MTAVLRVGVCTFRTLNDPLSGELHVLSGSSRRSGAREHPNPAKQKSRAPLAGSDDGNGPTDGESATPPQHTPRARIHALIRLGPMGPECCALQKIKMGRSQRKGRLRRSRRPRSPCQRTPLNS